MIQVHLDNGALSADLLNYGCTIMNIHVPDRYGIPANIVAGFDRWEQYLGEHPYLGCVIGRYANRIAHGKCSIAGKFYQLSLNDPPNHLHGGFEGFGRKLWQVKSLIENADGVGVVFSYQSAEGEEGYPGNLAVEVTYLLTSSDSLEIRYAATTNQTTIINLTNHTYFNLTAFDEPEIYNHLLQVRARQVLGKDKQQVPDGSRMDVAGSRFDFRAEMEIGKQIHHIPGESGYDHTFVLDELHDETDYHALLISPASGRVLRVFTDQPSLHIYTANAWDGQLRGNQQKSLHRHGAIALEAQYFPDSPNHRDFPSTVLQPGEVYQARTVFQFLRID